MLRPAVLSAGLAAALFISILNGMGSDAASGAGATGWAGATVESVVPGRIYRFDGCFTMTAPGATSVSLRIAWHDQPGGYGSAVYDDAPGNPLALGEQQCLSITNADAPCNAQSVRRGVFVVPDSAAVEVGSLTFSPQAGANPVPCPTPPPGPPPPSPTPTPTPTPSPPHPPPSAPPPTGEPDPEADEEPTLFPSLVNGGFEQARNDGTPYGWRKVGGQMGTSATTKAEGQRSATLASHTESTKWLYQSLSVEGGRHYRLTAKALKSDANVKEVLLRLSWYASVDGSGSQLATADSEPLSEVSPQFVGLDTGAVRAPAEARSARARLMLRPASAAAATAYFDDVRFEEVAAPPMAASTSGSAPGGDSGSRSAASGRSVRSARLGDAASLYWKGPRPLANVSAASPEDELPSAGGGGVPLWPAVLAAAMPAAGLALLAGDAWRRSRIAGPDDTRL